MKANKGPLSDFPTRNYIPNNSPIVHEKYLSRILFHASEKPKLQRSFMQSVLPDQLFSFSAHILRKF